MKGDFSRQTFDAKKHYSAVLMQQGRVQVDADWNEQQAINQHRLGTEAKDVIGKCGVPEAKGGFAITLEFHQLYDVFFIGSEKGWLVGDRGTIWLTVDGGESWTEKQSGVIQNLYSVYFFDGQKGWVVGEKGTILVTADGGETWTQQTSNVHKDLNAVYFADRSQGWAVGNEGTILVTSDGGENWSPQGLDIEGNSENLNSVYFVAGNIGWKGWAVGDNGTILATSNGGTDWEQKTSNVTTNLKSVYFTTPLNGWTVGQKDSNGRGTILATSDGGENWSQQGSDLAENSENLNRVYFAGNTGWAVGDNGKILVRTNDNDWTVLQSVPTNIGNLNSVYFVDASIGWAIVSSTGKFLTYQSGNWSDHPKQLYDFGISAGRIYVDGLLCENEELIFFAHQLDFLEATLPEEEQGKKYLFYLNVWQRHITPLDDPQIQEVALGGADTATRTKTFWQVKAEPIDDPTCSTTLPDWEPSTGTLKAQTNSSEPLTELCELPPTTGYKRIENQLYRVEIHQGGNLAEDPPDPVTFKWSRENGSVVTAIEEISDDGRTLTVANLGKDEVLGFASNQWVEVSDDRLELNGQPGYLVLIETIDPATCKITLHNDTPLDPNTIDMTRHPKLRRWDQRQLPDGPDVTGDGVSITPSTWIPLEDGIEVQFSLGTYKTGDYWLIPARTATAEIEWPPYDPEQEPIAQLPLGIEHHYCCLAIATFDGTNPDEPSWQIEDCRPLFSSLKELSEPNLFYVGGDGQEVMPVSDGQPPLPQPLQVRVVRGATPMERAKVEFSIFTGEGYGGELSEDKQSWPPSPSTSLLVETSDDGIAKCYWKLDPTPYQVSQPDRFSQRVKAELVGENNTLPIFFSANLSVASQVAYQANGDCPILQHDKTVQDAIDTLCTELQESSLFYVGGDGQEAMPDRPLFQPLQVGVANGFERQVSGAKVKFTIQEGGGNLKDAEGNPLVGGVVTTDGDGDGIASCYWTLGPSEQSQKVKAELVDDSEEPLPVLPIFFSANLSMASQVAYQANDDCPILEEAETVKKAIDTLCIELNKSQPDSNKCKFNIWRFGLTAGIILAGYMFLTCLPIIWLPERRSPAQDLILGIPNYITITMGNDLNSTSFTIPELIAFSLIRAVINFGIGCGSGCLFALCYNKMISTGDD